MGCFLPPETYRDVWKGAPVSRLKRSPVSVSPALESLYNPVKTF
jgi:hypothetical protein